MAASYRQLQARCTELKAQGKHTESCRQSAEALRRLLDRLDRAAESIPLVNDLLRIISVYSTELVVYRLFGFGRDYATAAYSPGFWRTKVLVETNGLVVDDSVVAGQWANYYRLVNRTYYGSVRMVNRDDIEERIGEIPIVPIPSVPLGIVAKVIGITSTNRDRSELMAQLPDNSLYFQGPQGTRSHPFGELIRLVVSGETFESFVVVTERGRVYYIKTSSPRIKINLLAKENTNLNLVGTIPAEPVVGIGRASGAGIILLHRNTQLSWVTSYQAHGKTKYTYEVYPAYMVDPGPRVVEVRSDKFLLANGKGHERLRINIANYGIESHLIGPEEFVTVSSGDYPSNSELQLRITFPATAKPHFPFIQPPSGPVYGLAVFRTFYSRTTETALLVAVDRFRSAYFNLDREGYGRPPILGCERNVQRLVATDVPAFIVDE